MKTPVGLSRSSGMIALNMPMQPSSNTPMIALSRRSCVGQRLAELALCGGDLARRRSGVTWSVVCVTRPLSQPAAQPLA